MIDTDRIRQEAREQDDGPDHPCTLVIEDVYGMCDEIERLRARIDELVATTNAAHDTLREENDRMHADNARTREELETERLRLAACGVVAMANTPETAAVARQIDSRYDSDSLHNVIAAVDREMTLRDEIDKLHSDLKRATDTLIFAEIDRLRAAGPAPNTPLDQMEIDKLRSAYEWAEQQRIDAIKEIDRLRASEDGRPDWTCASCGSRSGFDTVTHEQPGEMPDYDLKCRACGSVDVAESPHEALSSALDKIELLRAEVSNQLSQIENLRMTIATGGLQNGPWPWSEIDRLTVLVAERTADALALTDQSNVQRAEIDRLLARLARRCDGTGHAPLFPGEESLVNDPKKPWIDCEGCPACNATKRDEIERLRAALQIIANTLPEAKDMTPTLVEIARKALEGR